MQHQPPPPPPPSPVASAYACAAAASPLAVSAPPFPRTIVTGASSGVGRALVLELVRHGIPVLAVARSTEQLEALGKGHPLVATWQADLLHTDTLDALAAQWLAHYPDIGALINNAGVQHERRLDDTGYTAQDMGSEVAVNLLAPMVLTRALLPHLQSRQQAWVVNIGSVLGHCPKRTAAVYSATKAGLDLFTQALRVQVQGSAVRTLHAVMPLVDTPMTHGRGHDKLAPEAAARELVHALLAGRSGSLRIGKAQAAWHLQRWAPALLARMLRNA